MLEINGKSYCPGCFEVKPSGEESCPHCGYAEGTKPPSPVCLLPGSVLHDRYVVGKELGHGGFGITYLAFDRQDNRKIAVKEFFPDGMVTRSAADSADVQIYSEDVRDSYQAGLAKFVEENTILSQFKNNPNIVHVYDHFAENNTAYIVMEYVDGINLKQYAKDNGGALSVKSTLTLLLPVVDALDELHQKNILHRDISPDNLYLTKEGFTKLLDFGAARQVFGEKSKSLSVILKPGFAPEEQYRRKGVQGPWTDIYALGATMYTLLCGALLPDALDRLRDDDETKRPSELGVAISPGIEAVIMKSVAPEAQNRYQTIREFRNALVAADMADGSVEAGSVALRKEAFPLWAKIAVSAAAVVVVVSVSATLLLQNRQGGIFGLFKGGNLVDVNASVSSAVSSDEASVDETADTSDILTTDTGEPGASDTDSGNSTRGTTKSTRRTASTSDNDPPPVLMNIKEYGSANEFHNISDRQWAVKNGDTFYFIIRSTPTDMNKSVLIRYDSSAQSAKLLSRLGNGWLSDMYLVDNTLYYTDSLQGYQINVNGSGKTTTFSRSDEYTNLYQYNGYLYKFSNLGVSKSIFPSNRGSSLIYSSPASNCDNHNFAIYRNEVYFFDGDGNLCKMNTDGSGLKTLLGAGPEHFRIAGDALILFTGDGKIYRTDLNGKNKQLLFQGISYTFHSSLLLDYESKIIDGNYLYLSCVDDDEMRSCVIKRFSLTGDGKSEVIAKINDYQPGYDSNYLWQHSLRKFQIIDGYLYVQTCDNSYIGIKRINLSTKAVSDFVNVKDLVSEW